MRSEYFKSIFEREKEIRKYNENTLLHALQHSQKYNERVK